MRNAKKTKEIKIYENLEYMNLVNDIIENEQFQQLKNLQQHGTTRYLHSLKVSYNSYILAKKMNLDYVETARAGLLHDFFFTHHQDEETIKGIIKSIGGGHAKIAKENAKKLFTLNDKEENIIESHMFPFGLTLPRYKESALVDIIDDGVALTEWANKFRYQLLYIPNLLILLTINRLF